MGIAISHLTRRYGADAAALDDLDLAIEDGEFLALLGPSGSGKTTLLRILAGLDFPSAGSVLRDSADLLALDARERGVGMVFQHYALFTHMRVADNVAFGLRVRKRALRPPRAEIARRVDELLQRVDLAGFGRRYPAQLSGGQRQRVALARALATEPSLLLLDEPFGALDAKVRLSLRRWLRQLHEDLGLTTVFVTHDQDEAFALADRVVVMDRGRVQQVGTPAQIHAAPATPFVFEFVGRANRIPATVASGHAALGGFSIALDDAVPDGPAIAYLRPEHLRLHRSPVADAWPARIRHVPVQGHRIFVELAVEGRDEALEAELDGESAEAARLAPGQQAWAQPLRMTLFGVPDSADARAPAPWRREWRAAAAASRGN